MKDYKKIIKITLIVLTTLAAVAAVAFAIYKFLDSRRKAKPEFSDAMPDVTEDEDDTPEVDLDDAPEIVTTEEDAAVAE